MNLTRNLFECWHKLIRIDGICIQPTSHFFMISHVLSMKCYRLSRPSIKFTWIQQRYTCIKNIYFLHFSREFENIVSVTQFRLIQPVLDTFCHSLWQWVALEYIWNLFKIIGWVLLTHLCNSRDTIFLFFSLNFYTKKTPFQNILS